MSSIIYFILITISFFLSYFFCLKIKNYDNPGKDKIQKIKVLTSGGLFPFLFLSLILIYLIYFSNFGFSEYFLSIPQKWMAPICILIFVLISFYDDFNYIPFQLRLFLQLSLVYLSISLLPASQEFNFQTPLFNGLVPLKVDLILTVIFWTFIINSTNFIDGYDGMFSFQIFTNFLGLSIIFFIIEEMFHFQVSLLMFFIGTIFIPFNFSKKFKMYIGDAGSIPAGFVLGWMIISLINMGYYISAILINFLFLSDVLLTLIIRLIKRKSIFVRHNDFFFKKIIIKYGEKQYFFYAISLQIMLILLAIYFIH